MSKDTPGEINLSNADIHVGQHEDCGPCNELRESKRRVECYPALLKALGELVESHDALLNPASNRGEPAIGSALVDRLGAAWTMARAAIEKTKE